MVAGKEALIVLEQLESRQYRIWPDSCDLGLKLEDFTTFNLQKVIHDACAELAQIYKNKKSKWHLGVSWECFVPFEFCDGFYYGTKVKVSLNGTYARGIKFFSIDLESTMQKESPFKNNNPLQHEANKGEENG